MPLPPIDPSAEGDSAHRPARVLMDSPLATSTRVIARRRLTRQAPRLRWRRVVGLVGALLVHIVFLLCCVLGSPYQAEPPPEPKVVALHVRLIDAPEPPPPPPIRGTPPKEKGPRHKGHASQQVAASQHASPRSSEPSTMAMAQASPANAPPVVAQVTKTRAPISKPVAAPAPPITLPRPAPTPTLQPVVVNGPPPVVVLATPTLRPPVPPKFQPEPVRAPQAEGNQPMPPPASLAMSDAPAQAMPTIEKPTMALAVSAPQPVPAPSVTPASVEPTAAPAVTELQAIPLPAQPAPTVNLKTSVTVSAPSAARELPQIQAPTVTPDEAELQAVPVSPAGKPDVSAQAPTIKIDTAARASVSAVQTSIPKPELGPPTVVPVAVEAAPSAADTARPGESPDQSTRDKSTTDKSAAHATADATSASSPDSSASQASSEHDVSRAPDATPQGSDNATPGRPDGVANAPQTDGRQGTQLSPAHGQGADKSASDAGKADGIGKSSTGLAGTAPGDAQGDKAASEQGAIGSYVQVTPHGDTQIMDHRAPNLGYKPTRFDKDWTPPGESSVDTALRHAVEKTTASHTFHLPRGVRVECKVMPLLPMALFSCGNGDPPPAPVADKVYDRMHLAPAHPLAPPAPASSSAKIASAPVKLDNSAQCATARISGGPPPPGCEPLTLPVKLAHPASPTSSGSWVPASDQFH